MPSRVRESELDGFAINHPVQITAVESITCDRCAAGPRARCRTPSGHITWWHMVRKKAAGQVDERGNWL